MKTRTDATSPAIDKDLCISSERLQRRLGDLAAIGAIEGTRGCARLALTDEDKAGRDLVVAWMRDLGLEVTCDGIGNVVAKMAWSDESPPVMCGSHIDTVRTGGRYDGNLGVLAGLEVIETVISTGADQRLVRPLAVGFFTDEEGARYAPDMLGSLVYVGGMGLEQALGIVGIDGTVLGDELTRIGYAGPAPIPGEVPHAFVELHVEQGPVLEEADVTIGAVTGVQGISWTEVTVTGQSNHAGTTPISMRRDPALVAAQTVVFVRDLAIKLGHPQVATVGRIDPHPNLVNVVPSSVTFTVDLRNVDEAQLQKAERDLADFLQEAATSQGCSVATKELARFAPVDFDSSIVDLIGATAIRLGLSAMRLPSGAGHDAQMLARVCPTAMIFVPSKDGISHNPAEFTDPVQIEAGANVLLHTMLALATQRG